jgi:outer membrane protein assembly factor BamD
VGVCYYEESLKPSYTQEETVKAIDAFQIFLDKYPGDPLRSEALEYLQKAQHKLLEKNFLNGYIYYKMSDYSSALMYFDELIALGNHDNLEEQSLYYSARIYLNQRKKEDAQNIFKQMETNFPDSKLTAKIRHRIHTIW